MKYIQSSAKLRLDYIEVLKVLCREVNSQYSRKCLRELNRSFIRLEKLDLDLRSYDDPISMILDRQVSGMITKCPSLPVLIDPVQACRDTYDKFENQCEATNDRLASGRFPESDVVAVLFTARRKIANILGDLPQIEDLPFTYGPGATHNVKRRTSAFHKILAEPECTLQSLRASQRLLRSVPRLWTLYGGSVDSPPIMKIVRGSRFGQVPKSAKTNRPIDIEPTLNGVLQRGYGGIIRNRLGRSGNCIRSGQARHSRLARNASIHKELATIDFSGASDSISSHLVLDLLPLDWFDALDNCRSHYHRIDGEYKYLHKFSAMGNGFTFELETLIFLSLARACCDILGLSNCETSVYGDDVIIPTAAIDLFFKVCDWCGFTINSEKSFWGTDGFRESCGSDWFDGIDVRVAYMRHDISPHYLTTLHNRLTCLGIDHLIPQTIMRLRMCIPSQFRRFGPPSSHLYGYLHSWDHIDTTVEAVSFRPRKFRPYGRPTLAYAFYTSQFVQDQYDLDRNWIIRKDVQWASIYAREIGSQFDSPISMERFTIRNDFKLAVKKIKPLHCDDYVRDQIRTAS